MLKIYYDNNAIKIFGIATPTVQVIEYNGKHVGIIDVNITEEYVFIRYIKVGDEFRRQGIASKLIRKIMEENKGKYLYGDSLPGAMKFWESMGAEFHEDPFDDYLTPFSIEC